MFWLSLIPFATGWLGENHFAAAPAAIYGIDLYVIVALFWLIPDRRIEKALVGADAGAA